MTVESVIVSKLMGQAWLRDAHGQLVALRPGMRIPADAQLIAAHGSQMELRTDQGQVMQLQDTDMLVSVAEVLDDAEKTASSLDMYSLQAAPALQAILQAIASGADPLALAEPTAAVVQGGGDSEGSNFVRVEHVAETVAPLDLRYPSPATQRPPMPAAQADGLSARTTTNNIGADLAILPSHPSAPEAPEAPTEPNVPPAPVEPTEPQEPDQKPITPLVPEEPAEPVAPTEPELPVEPATPEEPTEPSSPAEPAEPVAPTEPELPVEPATPEEPTEPSSPAEPAEPNAPQEQEPTTPVDPAEPETPIEPDTPIEPVTPEAPTEPSIPPAPVEPTEPQEQDPAPTEPTDPQEPAAPAEPDVPTKPEEPAQPDEPNLPAEPEAPPTPVEPELPTDPVEPSTPAKPAPIVDAPHLQMQVTAQEVHTVLPAPVDPLAGTTAVNGGATNPNGRGFNLDAQGQVVAIGRNVQVWGTQTSKGPDGHTAINDFAQGIVVYQNGAFQPAQFGHNLIRYGYASDLAGNSANANAPQTHADQTDLFMLHSQSGVWMGNGSQPDGDYGSWQNFNNFTGNTTTKAQGAPDYAVLIGDAAQGAHLNQPTSNNAATHVNVLESLNIRTSTGKTVGQGLNKIEGVIAGDHLLASTPGHTDISVFADVPTPPDTVLRETVYDVRIAAQLNDVDASGEQLSSTVVLSGVPAAATVYYQGQTLSAQPDGSYVLNADLSADGHSLTAALHIQGAGTAGFALHAQAQAHDAQNLELFATAQATSKVLPADGLQQLFGSDSDDLLQGDASDNFLHGGPGNDVLVGGAGDDVLVWHRGDVGSSDAAALDVVQDFGHGNDVLDLRDLFDVASDTALDDWISATPATTPTTTSGTSSTVLHISPSGELANSSASQHTAQHTALHIVLHDVAMDTSDSNTFIRGLMEQGKLLVDL